MSSYNHFCFLRHIRSSAFPHVNPTAVLPSAEGSLRDALAEMCYFYAQNLPTTMTLLPCAGLALALLRISLVGYHSPTLTRELYAVMQRSLIRTRELVSLC